MIECIEHGFRGWRTWL